MQRREDDESRISLPPPGICQRLFRFVAAKLGVFEEKVMKGERNKPIKKRSRSDITIHCKQIEESEDNKKHKNKSHGSSSQESERETVDNGTTSGPKKRLHNKGKKSMPSPEAGKSPQLHGGLRPLLNDINKKSDAFIEKMRKSLA